MRGRTVRTPKKEAAFLRLIADGNSVGEAAQAIGCSRASVYDWRGSDDKFRRAWDAALDQATEVIESVLYNQARDGNLLACIVWLKSHRPALYNRRAVEAVGSVAAAPPLTIPDAGGRRHTVFYIPRNGRDEPAQDDPPAIDGEEAA